jgi:hypothetical protein
LAKKQTASEAERLTTAVHDEHGEQLNASGSWVGRMEWYGIKAAVINMDEAAMMNA